MTNEQIEQANQMHTSGVSWAIIARFFDVSENKLLKYRNHYGTTNNEIYGAAP